MDEFLTDEQQADKAKIWLRENGAFLVAGIVLGLALLFGWQRWDEAQISSSGEASVVYGQLRDAIVAERFNEVTQTLELLESEYSSTPYVDQAYLALARMHMDRNATDEALEALNTVVKGGRDPEIRRVAEYRIAQIYLYMERYDEALAILGPDDTSPFAGQFHDLRGDVYFAQGDLKGARDEYRAALTKDIYGVIDRAFVQMKLDDVSGSLSAVAVEAETDLPADAPADDE